MIGDDLLPEQIASHPLHGSEQLAAKLWRVLYGEGGRLVLQDAIRRYSVVVLLD
jgi:hypothetical protein